MEGYPYLKLKVKVDEALVSGVVRRLGGERFDRSRTFPQGVKPVDFLLSGYALDHKSLVVDPLVSQPDRPPKIAEFIAQKIEAGELKPEGNKVRLTGAVSQEYWRRFLGVSIGRHFVKAAEQIRSTRELLQKPDMKGAVILVNAAAPFIDETSFANLVQVQQRRAEFSDAINVVVFLSCIVGILDGRPAIPFGWTPEGAGHDEFCEKLVNELMKTIAESLDKSDLERVPHGEPIQLLRAPIVFDGGDGRQIYFH